jgi:hypothetical protein
MNAMRATACAYLSVPEVGCKIVAPLTKLQSQYLMHDEASPISIGAFLKVMLVYVQICSNDVD